MLLVGCALTALVYLDLLACGRLATRCLSMEQHSHASSLLTGHALQWPICAPTSQAPPLLVLCLAHPHLLYLSRAPSAPDHLRLLCGAVCCVLSVLCAVCCVCCVVMCAPRAGGACSPHATHPHPHVADHVPPTKRAVPVHAW